VKEIPKQMFSNKIALFTTALQGIMLIVLLLTGYANSTDIVIVYALETVLVGIFHAIKLSLIPHPKKDAQLKNSPQGAGLVLFFILHYGLFVVVQTMFFFTFLSMGDSRFSDGLHFENFATVIHFTGVQAAGAVFALVQIVKFITKFLPSRKRIEVEPITYMFIPYPRIFIQQFAAILPGFFIIFFSGNIAVALVIILFRTFVDLLVVSIKGDERFLERLALSIYSKAKTTSPKFTPESIKDFLKLVISEY
jgi:hypothetical protein